MGHRQRGSILRRRTRLGEGVIRRPDGSVKTLATGAVWESPNSYSWESADGATTKTFLNGSVRKLPDGYLWESLNYTIQFRNAAGRQVKETVGTSKKDAVRVLGERLKALQDGTYKEIRPISFRQYATTWMTGLGNLKPSTRAAYASMVTYQLVPAFGDYPLSSIGVAEINTYVAEREGKLKPKTLSNLLRLLHKLFEDAMVHGYLKENRLATGKRALRRPRALREGDVTQIDILDQQEVNAVLEAVDQDYYPLFLTAVLTGMRLGELLGLQWRDVDWAVKKIYVRRTSYKGQLYLPKTNGSRRAIDVYDNLLVRLRDLSAGRYRGTAVPAEDLVFVTAGGVAINPDNLRHRVWAPALAKAKLRHVRIHSLRHTFASMLIAQGGGA
jgi:integrase